MSVQALNTALTGLRMAQQQLNVISNNVANVGTPGYTRKILPQSTQVLNNGQGIGVLGDTIIRKVDMNLSRDLWTQVSSVSASDIKASYLSTIEAFHGPPDKELSISAYIAALKNDFTALSDDPSDGFKLQATLNQAVDVANKFNEFGKLITQMRKDAQDEISNVVSTINAASKQIALLNTQIKNATAVGRSTADMQDRRDQALKELSEQLKITYFTRGDGVIVVQTATGVELASDVASPLSFTPSAVTPTATYPSSLSGVYTNGDANSPASFDLARTKLGGKLGALLELRDETLVQYQAQNDELAHKLALRFDAQGLRLFTDGAGNIPSDAPPDPNTLPAATPVAYVGFSTNIRVNQAVIDNIKLLQQGTYISDKPIPSASNDVIRRVLDFTFGTVSHQRAEGNIDLRVTGPATDLQQWLGLYSSNKVISTVNLSTYPEIDDGVPATTTDMAAVLSAYFPNWPADASVDITFSDARTGLAATTITLDLSAAAAQPGGDALDQIIAEINAQITAQGVPAGFAAVATRNSNGQLVLSSRADITLNASGAGGMGATALAAIGLSEGTFKTEDPYFEVQVGQQNPVRIKIEPGDTETDLINKLRWNSATQTGVYGLNVDYNPATGLLNLRPGMDASNGGPTFGGDLKIIGGPFKTASPVNGVLAALPQNIGIVTALFGSYTVTGGTVKENSAIRDVQYGSETTTGSGVFVPYRTQHLGQAANVGSGILAATSIIDFGQKMVNRQTQDLVETQGRQSNDTTLRDLLQRRLTDESAVSIDEEMSNLIVVQTAYSAAARAVTAADEMFQELMNAFR